MKCSYTEMRITHFPTPWDEHSSSQRVRFYTVFIQLLTNPIYFTSLHI
jgi:hypothetical protein